MHKAKNVCEWKAMLLGERNIQSVVSGSGLQFEVERAAKSFAQCEAPRLVDAAAEGRMNHELHSAAFVEKALGNNRGLARHFAEHRAARNDILDELLRPRGIESAFLLQPVHCSRNFGMLFPRAAGCDVRSQLTHT